jgi:hypothetical protein
MRVRGVLNETFNERERERSERGNERWDSLWQHFCGLFGVAIVFLLISGD